MAVDSGDRLWQINTYRRFEDMLGPPAVLNELRHYLFFERQPYVSRVVFLATPHRGSDLSRGFVGRSSASLIAEPDQIGNLLAQLIKDNPNTFDRRFRRLPSSIETLEPDSKILEALLQMPADPRRRDFPLDHRLEPPQRETRIDRGVVPYHSAHFEGVASELVVPSDHSVQKSQDAIREVRRILLEHLGRRGYSTAAGSADARSGSRREPLTGAPRASGERQRGLLQSRGLPRAERWGCPCGFERPSERAP